ncbi:uncharacterized protein LOC131321170 [Rhododendron vialii]|uniref:uncharacterized protein LOC131321170 n=1 Tax=Rhododendron vialii TaxID=182163 RepID=UPI00265E851F|nr:uncharacterized protein LOC131321170 [Rhododendron vialii]
MKEVQRLTRMAVALNRFICRSSDKCRPFFQFLKKRKGYEWGLVGEQAFQDLKKYLAAAPLSSTSEPGESLTLYLAISEHVVSVVLPRDKGSEQIPVYYVSKTLLDAETRYLPLEKLVLALRIAARKLPNYFQSHKIVVYTEFSLKSLLRKADFLGRISTWSVELNQYDIDYQPRTAIKGDWGCAFSSLMELSIRLGFSASNNVAKYEALLAGLRSAKTLKNAHADSLAWLAAAVLTEFKRRVVVDYLAEPSIGKSVELVLDVYQRPSWMDPIVEFLRDGTLPTDKKEAHKIKTKSARFWLPPKGKLYRKSFTGPYLLYVHPEMVQNFLHEIHEGTYGRHAGGTSIAHRAITQGYWWPHMQKDAKVYVKICEKCQKFLTNDSNTSQGSGAISKRSSKPSVPNMGSGIIARPQPTHRVMDRQKRPTKPYLTGSRRGLTKQRGSGLTNCH